MSSESKNITIPEIINKLDIWISDSEKISETMRDAGFLKESETQIAYAQAYWNIKQFIQVNTK